MNITFEIFFCSSQNLSTFKIILTLYYKQSKIALFHLMQGDELVSNLKVY